MKTRENLRAGRQACIPSELCAKMSEFAESIKSTKLLCPDGNPKPEWKVFYGDNWEGAKETAKVAMQGPYQDRNVPSMILNRINSMRNGIVAAASDAGREPRLRKPQRILWKIASDATQNSINECGAGEEFALAARWLVPGAAELLFCAISVSDLTFKDREAYLGKAKEYWEVWEKGYALLGDHDGTLYVYAKRQQELALRA